MIRGMRVDKFILYLLSVRCPFCLLDEIMPQTPWFSWYWNFHWDLAQREGRAFLRKEDANG